MITTQIDTVELAKELAHELSQIMNVQNRRVPSIEIHDDAAPFAKLRARINELGYDHAYFAKKLKMTPATLSRRMTGKLQWQLNEMYAALEILCIPHEQLSDYFPKEGGKNGNGSTRVYGGRPADIREYMPGKQQTKAVY